MNNILEYLECSAKKAPNKTAVLDDQSSYTYKELQSYAKRIGSVLAAENQKRVPIVVFMEKSVEALASFLGIAYAGCFYVFVSPEQPAARINMILDITKATRVITKSENLDDLHKTAFSGQILCYHDIITKEIEEEKLSEIRKAAQDIDPLYCNFTSGSTGTPKGVLVSHRCVIDFMEYFPDLFEITQNDRIGNQAPFDFDVSVKDIYSALKVGATIVIIPKKYFSVITKLLDYLCEKKVTTLIWAVSAMCIVSQLRGFTYKVPTDVTKVLFSGEMMPVKQLKLWQAALPQAQFVNLYGPTEITCNCTYYRVEREFSVDEKLPIGKPFPNEKVFLLDENNHEIITPNVVGEICVSGSAVALGYYNNPEQTKKAFVQNPLNPNYIEIIYKTGDMACYNEDFDLCFAGRKDFQVKYMGHRIELEEIELVLNGLDEIQRGCCIFDSEKNRIEAFYVGELERKEIQQKMRETLPAHMIPTVFYKKEQLPLTANGKIDRKKLTAER